jgi:hypothetical protein
MKVEERRASQLSPDRKAFDLDALRIGDAALFEPAVGSGCSLTTAMHYYTQVD